MKADSGGTHAITKCALDFNIGGRYNHRQPVLWQPMVGARHRCGTGGYRQADSGHYHRPNTTDIDHTGHCRQSSATAQRIPQMAGGMNTPTLTQTVLTIVVLALAGGGVLVLGLVWFVVVWL
jgi:hypothetical protein